MTDPVLTMQGLTKSFKKKPALTGVDLAVPRGSVVGLIGKNGAGKTTLIKCALGLLRRDGGTALTLGEEPWNLSADAKARLGYVPQVVALHPWMKVRHIIDYTASFYEHWNHALTAGLVADWHLNLQDKVGSLSVGQLQTLAIVLALGHEPELLVLDEPAASLDPEARRDFLARVLEIAGEGDRTVLFSTHITSDLERVADRVAVLKAGRIVYDGELDALKDQVKRLHVTSPRPLPAGFSVPGALSVKVSSAEALIAVRGPAQPVIETLGRDFDARVNVEDLNLEDIFVELHRDKN